MCTQKTHRNLIKELYNHIGSACLTASKSNIPYSSRIKEIGASSLDGMNGSKSTMKKTIFGTTPLEELWFSPSRISGRYTTINTC